MVPLLTGLDIGVTLFAAGVGTLLFHVLTKFKVPVFLGSSFAFLPALFAFGGGRTCHMPSAALSWRAESM